jgi:uncharacterized membrane protein
MNYVNERVDSATACPYCLHVRSTGATRSSCHHAAHKSAAPARAEKAPAGDRRRLAIVGYTLASLVALTVFSTIGGIIGFTYLRGEKAASDSLVRARDIQRANVEETGAESLSREDQEIIRYSAVEYAKTKGQAGLIVENVDSNGTSATVTLKDPALGGSFVVEIVRGGRNHEWLCIGFRPGP